MENSSSIRIVIFVLFFVIFIVISLIYAFIKSKKTKQELSLWAKEKKWQYFQKYENQPQLESFNSIGVQAVKEFNRDKEVKITNILVGKVKNFDFWFAFYKGRAGATASNNRRENTTYNIFSTPMPTPDGELILLYRSKLIKLLQTEKLHNQYGVSLTIPQNLDLNWLLLSDIEGLNNLNLDSFKLKMLKQCISEANSIILGNGQLTYIVQHNQTFGKNKIEYYLGNLEKLRKIFSK